MGCDLLRLRVHAWPRWQVPLVLRGERPPIPPSSAQCHGTCSCGVPVAFLRRRLSDCANALRRLVPRERACELWELFGGPSRMRRKLREQSDAFEIRVHCQVPLCDRMPERGTADARRLRSTDSRVRDPVRSILRMQRHVKCADRVGSLRTNAVPN